MKILKKNIENKTERGSIVLEMTCIDDAYVLSSILENGDTVTGSTTRKLSLDGGRSQQKVTTRLSIFVESTNFDLETGIVDIKGKVGRENDYVRLGSYHTIHLAVGDKFEIEKKEWKRITINHLHCASKEQEIICILVFYDREYVVSLVSSVGTKCILKRELSKNKNLQGIQNAVLSHKEAARLIVIAGFSEIRNDFAKLLTKEGLEKITAVLKLSSNYKGLTNAKVINNMLVDREYSRIFSEVKYVDHLRDAEEFLKEYHSGSSLTSIGLNEVREAIEYGAVKKLFRTDAKLRPAGITERKVVDSIIAQVKELRGKICIIPVDHEIGCKLKDLGHIACQLQFDYK